MIPIAVVLLLVVVVFSVAVVVSNPSVFQLSVFGAGIPVTTAGVYFTGAGAMLVLILAAALLRRGLRRDVARRRQVRALQNAAGVKSLPIATRQQSVPRREPTKSSDSAGTTTGAAGVGSKGSATVAAPVVDPSPAEQSSIEPRTSGRSVGQHRTSSGPVDDSVPSTAPTTTSAAERAALLDEAEELTGDSSDR